MEIVRSVFVHAPVVVGSMTLNSEAVFHIYWAAFCLCLAVLVCLLWVPLYHRFKPKSVRFRDLEPMLRAAGNRTSQDRVLAQIAGPSDNAYFDQRDSMLVQQLERLGIGISPSADVDSRGNDLGTLRALAESGKYKEAKQRFPIS